MGKVKQNGRNKQRQGRFVRLGHELILSDAFLSLTPNARSLIVVLISRYTKSNGAYNNGEFWLSETDAADLMGVASEKTARSAFCELAHAGFIRMTKNAYFNVKSGERRARCWRLTWEFNDLERKPASNEWRTYVPVKDGSAEKRVIRGLEAVAKYKNELSQKQNTGANFTAMKASDQPIQVNNAPMDLDDDEKVPNSEQSIPVKYTPHIAIPDTAGFRSDYGLRMLALGLGPFEAAA